MHIAQWKAAAPNAGIESIRAALKASPLLWGWLLGGLLVTALQDGLPGLAVGLGNLTLLGLYVLLIRRMTPEPPTPLPVRSPWLELATVLGVFGLVLMIQLLDFGVLRTQPWNGLVQNFYFQVRVWVGGLGLPGWAHSGVFDALSTTLKQLLPTLWLIWLLGIRGRAAGVGRPHGRLTAVLVGITAASGLLTGVLRSAPLSQMLAMYVLGIFINALPEELFFRGLLLPRLEKAFASPANALVVSALLFNAMHLPLAVNHGQPLGDAVLAIFRTDYPTGLLWGYLYLRTRSILPGIFWHAANSRLGFIFWSM